MVDMRNDVGNVMDSGVNRNKLEYIYIQESYLATTLDLLAPGKRCYGW